MDCHQLLSNKPELMSGQAWLKELGKILALVTMIVSLGGSACQSAKAAPLCRQIEGHQTCILSIKRSAKYFWEYQVVVSVDGTPRPIEKYNCRQRIRTSQGKKVIPFSQNGVGDLICKLAN